MSRRLESDLDNLEFDAISRSQIASVMIDDIGVTQFEIVKVNHIAIKIRSSVPGSNIELDEAISGNTESGEICDRRLFLSSRRRNDDQPFFAFKRTEALRTVLMSRDFVEFSPPVFEPHNVEAGDAIL